MKKIVVTIFFLTLISLFHLCAEKGVNVENGVNSHLRISLLTCSEGNEDVAAAFGHSAIRVVDSLKNIDIVFNYGTYNFYEPGFIVKFLRGDLLYLLSVGDFNRFVNTYSRAGRSIVEREFNLTEEQKREVYDFLLNNAKPENREYLYDFLIDNCATRIRDIFNSEGFGHIDYETDFTYRERLEELIGNKYWLKFGTDLILGARVDNLLDSQQEMFLPFILEKNLSEYNNLLSGESLLSDPVIILQKASEEKSFFVKSMSYIFSPFSLFFILLLFYSLCVCFLRDKRRFHRMFSNIFYVVLGVAGLVLLFMWVGTNHIWTKANWNLLWMNPLFLLLPMFKSGSFKSILIKVLMVGPLAVLLGGIIIPQQFNIAFYPIVLLEIFVMVPAVVAEKRIIIRKR